MPTLNWIGKDAVVTHHKDVPFRLLEPVPELSCGNAASGNLIVQGDNLHALKSLLPRYAGQVKCIYIDPPYNTGNEGWAYNDNVNSPEIRKWLGAVVGKEGETLDRHDRWLCMMYPRLVLLRQFLREDGAIFVSIDDDEVHHLRALMDEIFGANHRLATLVWRTDGNFDNQAKIKNCHEYILAYAINPDKFPHPKVVDPSVGKGSKLNRSVIQNTIVKNGIKNPVSSVTLPANFPAVVAKAEIPARTSSWPHYAQKVVIQNSRLVGAVVATSGWSSRNLLVEFIENGFNPIKDSKGQQTRFVLTGTGAIESIKERQEASHVVSVVSGVGSTQSQSVALTDMRFNFPFPKPVDLVKYLISMVSGKDSLVLDSFAGSGTTGHAVLKQNAADGGNRRFILVEMDEKIAANITAERVKRVSEGYTNAKGEAVAGLSQEGGFQFCRLSAEPLFTPQGEIRDDVRYAQLAEFVWFAETGSGYTANELDSRLRGNDGGGGKDAFGASPLLGVFEGRAIYLLYNGILKDKSVGGGNVLTGPVFDSLPPFDGPKTIYAAACRLGAPRLQREQIVFKQTPYALEV